MDRGEGLSGGERLAMADSLADRAAGASQSPATTDPRQLPPLRDQMAATGSDAGGEARTPGDGDVKSTGGVAPVPAGGPGTAEPPGPDPSPSDPVAEPATPKTVASTTGDSDPASAESAPVTKPTAPLANEPPPPVVVISVDGARQPRVYPTLNAALVDAEDGSQIVLQYNGVRVESPLRVGRKNITIRGAEGFRPGIEFRPKTGGGDGVQSRMITVTAGPLHVINAELRMVVPRSEDARLVMFSLQRPEQVRLRDVVVTVANPARQQASVIELTPEPGAMRNMKKMMKEGMEVDPLELTIDRSVIRGHADLVHVRQTDSAELSMNHCVVALGGSLLHTVGAGGTAPKQRGVVELNLVHVSALLGENLIRLNSGEERRHLPVVRAQSRDSIYSHVGDRPLVAMSGNTDIEMFRGLLAWRNGQKNFFDDYSIFWWLGSDQDIVDFTRWKQQWNSAGSKNAVVAWQTPRPPEGDAIAGDRLGLSDFRLADQTQPVNRPEATDGTDAGANLDLLPSMLRAAVPTKD